MPPRLLLPLLSALLVLAVAAPASASSVAFIDGHNLWYSSPDGARKVQVTSGGTADASWMAPSQGRDGKTVVVHRDTFEGGSKRPVLYLYGSDGKLLKANVMPVYSGATAPVYPIGLDMDWNSNAVAYGYSYCGWACQTSYKGYWLTFSDNQGAYPSNPQGASDAYNPTFYGTRVVSSDSGGRIFVQPDVPEAPFTSSYQSWLSSDDLYLTRAEVSPANHQVAVEWVKDGGAEGIIIAQHDGNVPGGLVAACDLQVAAHSGNLTFSPDGSQIAWRDDQGVKVAGAPNMAAGTDACTLSAPARVISTSGTQPSFGGADVAAVVGVGGGQPAGGGTPAGGAKPGGAGSSGGTAKLKLQFPLRATRSAFAKGITLKVTAAKAGRIDGSASIPAKVARKLGLRGKARAARISAGGHAAAAATVVARGSARAKRAGVVKLRLKPTKAAKRAAKRMRKVVLTIKVSQAGAAGSGKLKLK